MSLAELALYAWVPVSLCLFAVLRPRQAVLAAYMGAWLFLPMASFQINILPDISKVTISSMGVLLGVLIFDPGTLLSFRPRWFDLPMAVWCLCPFVSSITNGLGWWDGLSAIIGHVVLWGIPYLLGRVYFNDWSTIRDLAVGVFIGGVIYIPLCLWEVKMSPQLHNFVYGYHQHSFAQTYRFGGYRPMVFMQSGLALGFWMTSASLIGVWLWKSKAMKDLWGVPMFVIVPLLLVTTVLCKATAGLLFLAAGLATLFWMWGLRNSLPLLVLIAFTPLYMVLRTTGTFTGQSLVDLSAAVFNEDRAQSLQTRIDAENLLTERAMERPGFGWGRWNPDDPRRPKWRVYNEKGKDIAVTDGMWVITMGTTGLVGLFSATAVILLPVLLLRRRVPVAWWAHPMAAPAAALAMILVLHMLDNLLNAMLNPIFVMAIGGIGALGTVRQPAPQQQRGFQVVTPNRPRPVVPAPVRPVTPGASRW